MDIKQIQEIFRSDSWQPIREMLEAKIEELRDIRNIDIAQRQDDVALDVKSNLMAYKKLCEFYEQLTGINSFQFKSEEDDYQTNI